ncbi:MAG: glycosyltransferase [Candidatus Berkelbacteria bacterium]|nr:glycosyltransferase [Candidatus Berkelbacteria bacterium]
MIKNLSFCAIIKDNLRDVHRLLENIQGLAKEIIIVDTGSIKEVVEFEKKYASKLLEIPWNNDFAYMRNSAIKVAEGDWILTLDSDETLTEDLKKEIPKLIKNPNDVEGFRFKRIHYVDESKPMPDYWMHLRLYKRRAHYFGTTHESIKNLKNIAEVKCKNCFILHHNNRQEQRAKSLKYSKYLKERIKESKKKKDAIMLGYYQYKLWVQENVYLLETDPKVDYKLLQTKYKEYEKRKKIIEDKIKKEGWRVNQ